MYVQERNGGKKKSSGKKRRAGRLFSQSGRAHNVIGLGVTGTNASDRPTGGGRGPDDERKSSDFYGPSTIKYKYMYAIQIILSNIYIYYILSAQTKQRINVCYYYYRIRVDITSSRSQPSLCGPRPEALLTAIIANSE